MGARGQKIAGLAAILALSFGGVPADKRTIILVFLDGDSIILHEFLRWILKNFIFIVDIHNRST